MTAVKICGLSTAETLSAAIKAGAQYVGFVFYEASPRYITPETARQLALQIPTGIHAVGLFVNPADQQLEEILNIVPLNMLQLHGNETPQRLAKIKARFSLPIMKAIRLREPGDLDAIEKYEETADWLLFDSRPEQATLPGGTGQSFDWNLLKNKTFSQPWMLSGGLTAENVGSALAQLSPAAVDVSSGVESAPGQKNTARIKAFIDSVKTAI